MSTIYIWQELNLMKNDRMQSRCTLHLPYTVLVAEPAYRTNHSMEPYIYISENQLHIYI